MKEELSVHKIEMAGGWKRQQREGAWKYHWIIFNLLFGWVASAAWNWKTIALAVAIILVTSIILSGAATPKRE